jgi:hypothetical protein
MVSSGPGVMLADEDGIRKRPLDEDTGPRSKRPCHCQSGLEFVGRAEFMSGNDLYRFSVRWLCRFSCHHVRTSAFNGYGKWLHCRGEFICKHVYLVNFPLTSSNLGSANAYLWYGENRSVSAGVKLDGEDPLCLWNSSDALKLVQFWSEVF